jgi:hypothetical protein
MGCAHCRFSAIFGDIPARPLSEPTGWQELFRTRAEASELSINVQHPGRHVIVHTSQNVKLDTV